MTTPVGRLRLIGLFEGASFLFLLGVAMPLKYIAGYPEAVSVVGMAHGVLFLIYCLAIVLAIPTPGWTHVWTLASFVAAVLPFGPVERLPSLRAIRNDSAALAKTSHIASMPARNTQASE